MTVAAGHTGRYEGTEERMALCRFANGVDKVCAGGFFGEIAAGAGLDGGIDFVVAMVSGEHENF